MLLLGSVSQVGGKSEKGCFGMVKTSHNPEDLNLKHYCCGSQKTRKLSSLYTLC